MPQLALALYALFLLLAFGLRTLVHYRRTGSTGLRLPPPGTPVVERLGSALFVLAVVLGIVAPVMTLTGILAPLPFLNTPPIATIGLVLYVLGLGATLWAQFAMGTSWRIGVDVSERTTLVTHGPFALVRNPIYAAMFLAAAGITLLVPNVLAVAAFMSLLVGIELHVRMVEEPYLGRTHGAAYGTYAATTGRFLPGVGRLL